MSMKQQKRTGDQCIAISLPELLQLSKSAKEFSLSALRSRRSQSGQRMSPLLARGMEFAESRQYQVGDDCRTIDWRVTARTGKAHTKLFVSEKERRVILAVDLRSSMFFATQGVFKSVQAALMSGYVAWNAVQSGDRLGGIIFDDRQIFESRPALGKRGALSFLYQLAKWSDFKSIKRETSLAPKTSGMDRALASIRQMATPGSLVFMISDFRHLSPYANYLLFQISRHSDLCLCFVYDPLEASLPKNGYYPVTDGIAELDVNTYDKRNLEKYHHQFVERRNQVASLGEHHHVHFIECSTTDECFNLLKRTF